VRTATVPALALQAPHEGLSVSLPNRRSVSHSPGQRGCPCPTRAFANTAAASRTPHHDAVAVHRHLSPPTRYLCARRLVRGNVRVP
jgi:hypothetical protein